ncbi:hypothetical protein QR685DRAFT_255270 [Neurospora intermedia]|uniref:Questionable protein n=1 Tax=Neurospora intermedia TaxID=5142 RepID=A0ABR3DDQ1_NEUIN
METAIASHHHHDRCYKVGSYHADVSSLLHSLKNTNWPSRTESGTQRQPSSARKLCSSLSATVWSFPWCFVQPPVGGRAFPSLLSHAIHWILSARKLQHSRPPSHVPSRASPLHLQYINRSSSSFCHHQETNPVPRISCRMAEWRSGPMYCCAHANSRVRRFETNTGKDSQTNKSELKRSSYCYKRLLGNKKPIKDKSAML